MSIVDAAISWLLLSSAVSHSEKDSTADEAVVRAACRDCGRAPYL